MQIIVERIDGSGNIKGCLFKVYKKDKEMGDIKGRLGI